MFPTISPLGLKKYKYRMHVATLEILHTLFLLSFGLVSNAMLHSINSNQRLLLRFRRTCCVAKENKDTALLLSFKSKRSLKLTADSVRVRRFSDITFVKFFWGQNLKAIFKAILIESSAHLWLERHRHLSKRPALLPSRVQTGPHRTIRLHTSTTCLV